MPSSRWKAELAESKLHELRIAYDKRKAELALLRERATWRKGPPTEPGWYAMLLPPWHDDPDANLTVKEWPSDFGGVNACLWHLGPLPPIPEPQKE